MSEEAKETSIYSLINGIFFFIIVVLIGSNNNAFYCEIQYNNWLFFQETSRRNVLERLDSDTQKLENLQITVQDLKQKVEITEKTKKGKGIEYDSVKEQLEESEDAIAKLFDINCKLIAKARHSGLLSFDGKSSLDLDSTENIRRRKISEQAQRVSEKIGRLQLEVQKLQFLLLKLDDDNNKSRGKVRVTDKKPKVLLRDYLYGGGNKNSPEENEEEFVWLYSDSDQRRFRPLAKKFCSLQTSIHY